MATVDHPNCNGSKHRMSLKVVFLCQIAFVFALADSSLARTINCSMLERSNSQYIAPEISLTLLDYGEVSIKDSIIASTGKKVVLGTVSSKNSRRISVYWEVRNVPADPLEFRSSRPKLQIRLTIQKQNGAAALSAVDLVHGNLSYRGTGVCRFEG